MDDKPHKNQTPTYRGDEQPGPLVESEKRDESAEEHHRAQERAHWAHEKRINIVTIVIAVGALFAAGISAYFSNQALQAAVKAANEAARQADAAFADERPWVGGPTKIVRKNISVQNITFTHVFKNVGKSSTSTLYIDAKLINDENGSWYNDAKRMCEKADAALKLKPPFTSIPGAEWVIDLNQMPESSHTKIDIKALGRMSSPYIVGCVSYNSPFDTIAHHTGYAAKIISPDMGIQFIYTVDAN
jgi:hypothetical protein